MSWVLLAVVAAGVAALVAADPGALLAGLSVFVFGVGMAALRCRR